METGLDICEKCHMEAEAEVVPPPPPPPPPPLPPLPSPLDDEIAGEIPRRLISAPLSPLRRKSPIGWQRRSPRRLWKITAIITAKTVNITAITATTITTIVASGEREEEAEEEEEERTAGG